MKTAPDGIRLFVGAHNMQINYTLFILAIGLLSVGMLLAFYRSCKELDLRYRLIAEGLRIESREKLVNLAWYCKKYPVYNLPSIATIEEVRKSTMLEF